MALFHKSEINGRGKGGTQRERPEVARVVLAISAEARMSLTPPSDPLKRPSARTANAKAPARRLFCRPQADFLLSPGLPRLTIPRLWRPSLVRRVLLSQDKAGLHVFLSRRRATAHLCRRPSRLRA